MLRQLMRRKLCALLVIGGVSPLFLSGCAAVSGTSEVQAAYGSVVSSGPAPALIAAASRIGEVPVAYGYLRMGSRLETLLILAEVDALGYETWLGADGITVIMRQGELISSRGLPSNLQHSYLTSPSPLGPFMAGTVGAVEVQQPFVRYFLLEGQAQERAQLVQAVRVETKEVQFANYSGSALIFIENTLEEGGLGETRTWLDMASRTLLRKEIKFDSHAPVLEIEWFRQLRPVRQ